MKQWIIGIALACWTIISFAAEETHQDSAITITIPEKWFILEKENTIDSGSVTLNREGYDIGFIQVEWMDNREYDSQDNAEWAMEALAEVDATNIVVTKPTLSSYGKYPAEKIATTAVIYNIARQMNFYEFTVGHYTVSVQTSQQRQASNSIKSEYRRIADSLKIITQ